MERGRTLLHLSLSKTSSTIAALLKLLQSINIYHHLLIGVRLSHSVHRFLDYLPSNGSDLDSYLVNLFCQTWFPDGRICGCRGCKVAGAV
jgi:hypothetical protein